MLIYEELEDAIKEHGPVVKRGSFYNYWGYISHCVKMQDGTILATDEEGMYENASDDLKAIKSLII